MVKVEETKMNLIKKDIYDPDFDLKRLNKDEVISLIYDSFDYGEICFQSQLEVKRMTRTQNLVNEFISSNLVEKICGISISNVKSVKELKKRLQMNIESRMYDYTFRFIGKILEHYVFKSIDNKKTYYMLLCNDNIFVQNKSPWDNYHVTVFSCSPQKELTTKELTDVIFGNIIKKKNRKI